MLGEQSQFRTMWTQSHPNHSAKKQNFSKYLLRSTESMPMCITGPRKTKVYDNWKQSQFASSLISFLGSGHQLTWEKVLTHIQTHSYMLCVYIYFCLKYKCINSSHLITGQKNWLLRHNKFRFSIKSL